MNPNHRWMLGLLVVGLIWASTSNLATSEESRPNILWITAEDMSATLGCYGDAYATTPNLDRLATQSVRYTHAFATAPVCSPSRSCLITGCYAPSLGTAQMRSFFPLPEWMHGFPAYLRDAGYYTSNNVKTDYNTSSEARLIKECWDQNSDTADWNGRANKDQPFFSIFNLMVSHQSRTMAWPYDEFVKEVQRQLTPEEIHDPAQAPVPPYYPDTPVIRRTIARYYDCVTVMDKEVGAILKKLDDDGLADDTIVFFYSDHGSGLPRHKRVPLDSGNHIPMLVRFPEKYRHLAPAKPGETTDRLVSFVDFGSTVLSLAGVEIPKYMQGKPFLGDAQSRPREYVHVHRDRIDEAFDTARAVRAQRYLYVRTYRPYLGYNQPSAWPDAGEVNHEFYRLTNRDTMTDAQWHFAAPTRPIEELYDCEADPLNVTNLIDSPIYREPRERLRKELRSHLRQTRDLGFIPEPEAWELIQDSTPWEAARKQNLPLEALYDAAESVGVADEETLLKHLKSDQPLIRYWGAVGLTARDSLSVEAREVLQKHLKNASVSVRIRSADALARHGQTDDALPVLIELLETEDLNVLLSATRTVELIAPEARSAREAMSRVLERTRAIRESETTRPEDRDLAWFCEFSAGAFVARVKESP